MADGMSGPMIQGRVIAIHGVLIRARLPVARIADMCVLRDPRGGRQLQAQVVALEGEDALLSPIGGVHGLSVHTQVVATGQPPQLDVGDHLLGTVVDPLGQRLDREQQGSIDPSHRRCRLHPVYAPPVPPMQRRCVSGALITGIRAIDGLLTMAHGQRIGLLGSAGVGKSSLMTSLIAQADADVVILGLVGERGREVRELIEERLDPQLRKRLVAVVATSDRAAAERAMAADTATCIAEYFRDRGLRVLLLIDSLTRYARALRELGLAAGEPPARRGYPPSFFAALPRLLERAGCGQGEGSITGIYTILTEGDITQDPVAEEAISILDGHIVLSDILARRNHFPAIDILHSRSRLMPVVVNTEHALAADAVRDALARLDESELLRQVGEYRQGVDPLTDRAVARADEILAFLRQEASHSEALDSTVARMKALLA